MLTHEDQEQFGTRRSTKSWRMIGMIIVTLAFGMMMSATMLLAAPPAAPAGQEVNHDGDEFIRSRGVVTSRPDEKVGTWEIGGKEYTAVNETVVEGGPQVGSCVEVKVNANQPSVAVKIESKEAAECEGGDDGDGDDEFHSSYGIVNSRPDEKVGTWVISDTEYVVNEQTVVEGVPQVDSCVEVKVRESAPGVAVKIETKDDFKCNGGDDGGDHGGDDEFLRSYGIVNIRPDEKVGTWVISDTEYIVNVQTVVEGAPKVGSCVEVKVNKNNPTVALKIETKDAFKCDGKDDDGEHHGDDDYIRRFGIIESRPNSRVGQWVISTITYTSTEETRLEEEHGGLPVGACVELKVLKSDPTTLIKLSSEREYKCTGRDDEDDEARGLLFGVIEQLPPTLTNGEWIIGGLTFVVSPTTEIITKGQEITVGVTVKVNFVTDKDEVNYARRIEVKFGNGVVCRRDHDDHKDDHDRKGPNHEGGDDHGRHYGYCPGHEGKTFGLIESRPQGTLLGEWMIGGVPYLTNAATQFHHDDNFLVGERVKVVYVVLDNNTRLATKLQESDDNGGVDNPNHSMIVGFVNAKPEAFIGDWTINGAPFVAVSDTIFIERGSLFAVGAYVVVEYEITNDQRVIYKIVTHVPPGAGDEDKIGRLESIGGATVAGVNVPSQQAAVWTISGVNYIVTEATQLVDAGGELVPGTEVLVNSYTVDGQRFATMIRAQGGGAYMPLAIR